MFKCCVLTCVEYYLQTTYGVCFDDFVYYFFGCPFHNKNMVELELSYDYSPLLNKNTHKNKLVLKNF